MGFAAHRLRTGWRTGLRQWAAALAVLTLAGAAAITAATAARRTDTAFARALDHGHAADVLVSINAYTEAGGASAQLRTHGQAVLDELARAPEVVAAGRTGGANIFRPVGDSIDQRLMPSSAVGYVLYDDNVGRNVSVFRMRAGRMPDPARVDEVVINPRIATLMHWKVGDRLTDLRVYNPSDFDETGAPAPGKGTPLSLRVVGIGEPPEDLLRDAADVNPRLYFTEGFGRRHPDSVFYLSENIRLRNGTADIPALRATLARLSAAQHIDLASYTSLTSEGLRKVDRQTDPLVNGLWVLAALAAVVGLLLAAQSIARVLRLRADEHAQMRAMGATRRQRFAGEGLVVLVAVVMMALGASVLAMLLSPLTPVGVARTAEPHRGFTVNFAVTGAGAAILVLGALLVALPSLWRVASARDLPGRAFVERDDRPSRAADLAARAGFPAPAVVGTRLALQPGRGASATPVRSVLASLVIVITAVTATVAFGVNLERLVTTPHLYGWNWDAAAGSDFGAIPPDSVAAAAKVPGIERMAGLAIGDVTIGGRVIPAIGVDQLRGRVALVINEGTAPATDNEIALGAKTLRAVHAHIGDTVAAKIGERTKQLRIVGTATFPAFGSAQFTEAGLGIGALGRAALFAPPDPSGGKYNYLLLSYAGPGSHARGIVALRARVAELGCIDPSCVITDLPPTEIGGFRAARGLPVVVGVVLALLLIATLTHVLLSTISRRRRDFEILRALGCVRGQLASVIRWQVMVLCGLALAIGIPVGLVGGRLAWNAFTDQFGIAPGAVFPFGLIATGAAAVVLLAWAIAAIASRRLGRAGRRANMSA